MQCLDENRVTAWTVDGGRGLLLVVRGQRDESGSNSVDLSVVGPLLHRLHNWLNPLHVRASDHVQPMFKKHGAQGCAWPDQRSVGIRRNGGHEFTECPVHQSQCG